MLLCLILLTSCSRKMVAIEPLEVVAPMHLAQVENVPAFEGKTNGELLEFTKFLQMMIEKQNINIKAIKSWLETL